MVRFVDDIRLIVEMLCGILLVVFIGGVMLIAAFAIGWEMALGMSIAFALEIIKRVRA